MKTDVKRLNFNVTLEQEAQIAKLREALGRPTTKDVILLAVRVTSMLVRETQDGGTIYVEDEGDKRARLLIPQLDTVMRKST